MPRVERRSVPLAEKVSSEELDDEVLEVSPEAIETSPRPPASVPPAPPSARPPSARPKPAAPNTLSTLPLPQRAGPESELDLDDLAPDEEVVAAALDHSPPPPPVRRKVLGSKPMSSHPPPPVPPRPTGAPAAPRPEASVSIHPDAYGDIPELLDEPGPSLADREAVARELVALCLTELKETRDKARRARLHYECARLCEMPLGDLDAALDHYQQARALASQHGPTIAGLRRVRMLRGEWEAAQKALAEEIEIAPGPGERAALYYLRGVLFEQRLGRPSDARANYAAALAQIPGDVASLRALLRSARRERRHAEVLSLLERLAEAAEQDPGLFAARAAARARAAETEGGEPSEVLPFYQRAIEADPLASGALLHAERITSALGQFQELALLGKRRVELLLDPSRRAAALLSTAEVTAERLGDRKAALALLEQASRETPSDSAPLLRLAELYHQQGDHTDELRTLLRLEHLETETSMKVELRLRIAELYRHRLDSLGDAITWFEKARELAPSHPGAADSLADLYRLREDWRGLVHVLAGREAASKDLDQRAALHIELAELFERKLEDRAAAINSLKAAVGLVPDHPGAFRALSRLLHSERRFAELVEVHEAAVDLAGDDAEAISHLLAIAQLAEDLLSSPTGALSAYQRILEREPRHLLALRGVQRVAVTAGQPEIAIVSLQREADQVVDPARKVPLLLRAAEIADRQVGSLEQATALYKQVVGLSPTNRPALSALGRIYRGAGHHKELIQTMQLELGVMSSRQERSQHLLRIGQVAEDLLADDALALATYQKALSEDPDSRHAASCVKRTLERRGERAALARILETQLHHEKDTQAKLALSLELARLYELCLGKPKEALHAYDVALATDEASHVARDGRIRCLALLGEHKMLAAALDQLADDPSDQASMLWALLLSAEVHEGELGLPVEAAKRYERVLAARPGHRGALEGLERIYNQTGDGVALLAVQKKQVGSYELATERVASLRELARILETDSPEAARGRAEAAAAILELVPEDERALAIVELGLLTTKNAVGLAGVDRTRIATAVAADARSAARTRLGEFLEASQPEQALALHRPALGEDPENIGAARGVTRLAEQLGRVELLVEAAESESRVVQSPERVSSLFRRAASLEQAAGREDEAVRILHRCLSLHPDDAACAQDLYRLLASGGRYEELVESLQTAATRAHNPDVRAGHWISVARLLSGARKDLPAAIAALLRVEKSQPAHFPTLIELAELYIRDRQWKAAATRLEKALSITQEEEQARPARLRLAEIYHEHLDRTPEAVRLLREVLRHAPDDRSALRRLLYIEVEARNASARATAEAWVKVSSGSELAEALTLLGRLQRDAGQVKEALASMTRAVELSGHNPKGASRDVVRLLEAEAQKGRTPEWSLYEQALRAYIGSLAPASERAKACHELARVYFDRLSDAQNGEAALRKGLELSPEATPLLVELCGRLVSLRAFDRALPELYRLIDREPLSRDVWTLLTDTFDALGKNADTHLATGALVLLGGGSELQRSTWSSRQARPALVAEGSAAYSFPRALEGGLPEQTRALLGQLTSLLSKVYPNEVSRHRLSAKDRVPQRGVHPVRPLLDRVLRAFRGIELDLYPTQAGGQMGLLLADPIGLIVPADFVGLTEVEQTFCLARYVSAAALLGAAAPTALGLGGTEQLLAAASHALVPEAATQLDGETLELSRRLSKALPWLAKGRFEEAARRYAHSAPGHLAEGMEEDLISACRMALVLCDDLTPLGLIEQQGERLLGLVPGQVSRLRSRLLAFWVSEQAMAMRREMGLGS